MATVRALLGTVRARLRRARFGATPISAWPMLMRSRVAGTRVGRKLIARRQRSTGAGVAEVAATPSVAAVRADGRNVLLVSHCDFTGQSAYHVYSIATELQRRGWSPAIAVPRNPRGARDLGRPSFRILSYRDAERGRLAFPDGHGPDLVHAFTPRQHVREVTTSVVRRYACRYVVHLEDNEDVVKDAVPSAHDPEAIRAFIDGAAGMSVIVERLLQLKPDHLPGVVVWPGYDEVIDRRGRSREVVRRDLGLEHGTLAILYTGNVHEINVDEVRSLYDAVNSLRANGRELVLLKSGWNRVPSSVLPAMGDGLVDLGWVARSRIPELLTAADILVQPGAPGPFNDYRFPSKLPEYLASGRPVVLPRTNIGLHLRDGVEALLLERGDASEIAGRVASLADDPALRLRLGEGGRAFALRELQWSKNVGAVVDLYADIRSRRV